MAKDINKIRKEVGLIKSHVKQNKIMLAFKAMRDAVALLANASLTRSEREEIETHVDNGTLYILTDQEVKRAIGMDIKYVKGKEKELLPTLDIVIETYQEYLDNKADEDIKLQKAKAEEEKNKALFGDFEKAKKLYESGASEDKEEAFTKFMELGKHPDFPAQNFAEIAMLYFNAQEFDNASVFFAYAIDRDSSVLDWYIKIGMCLRKTNKFEEAEKYYFKAAKDIGKSANLFFNLARLYFDWKKWDKAIQVAEATLKLDPSVVEAQKLIDYIKKQEVK